MWVARAAADSELRRKQLGKVPEKVKFKNIDFIILGHHQKHVQVNEENLLQFSANCASAGTLIGFCNRDTHAIDFLQSAGESSVTQQFQVCMTVNWLRPWQV